MYEYLISEYIKRMKKEDVLTFARNYGITLNDKESDIVYEMIKDHWHTVIYGNPRPLLDELKQKLNDQTYPKVEALYLHFKQKYENYL